MSTNPPLEQTLQQQPAREGGPAFPCHSNPMPGKLLDAPRGMTLRDYFAAKVLPVLIAELSDIDCDDVEGRAQGVARESYVYADAMLKARQA